MTGMLPCSTWKQRFQEQCYQFGQKRETCQTLAIMSSLMRVARVAELADAPDLGSGVLGRGGSSPLSRTTNLHQ